MNTISWFVYGAEIVGRASNFLMVMSVLFVFCGFIATMIGVPKWVYHSWHDKEYRDGCEEIRSSLRKYGPRAWFVGIVFAFIAVFIPSQRTMYLIAGSEIGESIVTSPDAVEMFNGVKAVIQKRLRDELGSK